MLPGSFDRRGTAYRVRMARTQGSRAVSLPDEDPRCIRRLCAAVVLRAVTDAREGRKRDMDAARYWLAHRCSDLWIMGAGMRPEAVRSKMGEQA